MTIQQGVSITLITLGEICILISILGVFRLKYVLNRMHATTIADTLGTLLVMLGVISFYGFQMVSAKLLLVLIFQWLTAPVSGHLIARMLYFSDPEQVSQHAEILYDGKEEEP